MLDGRSSVDSYIYISYLHVSPLPTKPSKHSPSAWFIAIPDFRLKTTFMNHDLRSGGKVGLQISDLDAIRFLLQNIIGDVKSGLISIIYYGCRLNYLDTSWCWFETSQRPERFVYSQCGCLVGSCLLWYNNAWIWQNVWLADNLNCVIFCYHQMRQPPTCKVEGNLVSNMLMQGFDIFKIRVPVFYRFTMKYTIFQCYHHTDRCSWEIMRVV